MGSGKQELLAAISRVLGECDTVADAESAENGHWTLRIGDDHGMVIRHAAKSCNVRLKAIGEAVIDFIERDPTSIRSLAPYLGVVQAQRLEEALARSKQELRGS
jgi:hypothetical protein